MNEVFTNNLKHWGDQNRRDLPWVGEKNPYRIWLSEVILQQTRVEQGLPYYERFLRLFPDVQALASAPRDTVFKAWEGLGYYSRARNLMKTASLISNDFGGIFPADYEGLKALPGVGEYTAAAIASFAYNQPHAVLDGNVFRVLARFFGIAHPVDSTAGRKMFRARADAVLDRSAPGRWNQALMDFGSSICKPRNPLCSACPVADNCTAFLQDSIAELPRKKKKTARRTRYFHYLIPEHEGVRWVRQRASRDIWTGLYEFPLVENPGRLDPEQLLAEPEARELLGEGVWEVREVSPWYHQA